jgi:hypothetical protein
LAASTGASFLDRHRLDGQNADTEVVNVPMVFRQPDMKLIHGSDQWLVAIHSSTPVAGAPSRKAHHLVLVSRPDRFATAFPHFDGIQISDFFATPGGDPQRYSMPDSALCQRRSRAAIVNHRCRAIASKVRNFAIRGDER